jgi:hypothetical protein
MGMATSGQLQRVAALFCYKRPEGGSALPSDDDVREKNLRSLTAVPTLVPPIGAHARTRRFALFYVTYSPRRLRIVNATILRLTSLGASFHTYAQIQQIGSSVMVITRWRKEGRLKATTTWFQSQELYTRSKHESCGCQLLHCLCLWSYSCGETTTDRPKEVRCQGVFVGPCRSTLQLFPGKNRTIRSTEIDVNGTITSVRHEAKSGSPMV